MITVGTDAELFAKTKDGQFKAICGLIGGTKEKPMPLGDDYAIGFAYQEDNVAYEFNIPPCDNSERFSKYIQTSLDFAGNKFDKLNLTISKDSAAIFNKSELVHPNALVFGCEPDYNAWTKKENKKPYCDVQELRTAGGHVHVGTHRNMIEMIQNMDLFLGVPSVLLDDNEGAQMRRQLYGKAGAMRPKPYGCEYRVLSNFWVFSKELSTWVFKSTLKAASFGTVIKKSVGQEIQRIINEGDKDGAKTIIQAYGVALPASYTGS